MTSQKIYIIHGWTYDTSNWEKSLELLRSEGLEPIMLNVPGLTDPSTAVWTLSDYVEWLHSQIKSKKKPIIVAHSNGGRIAMNYDLKYPGHIDHLVLVSSAGIENRPRRTKFKRKLLASATTVLKPLKYLPLVKKVAYKLLGAQDYNNAPPNMKLTLRNMLNSDKKLDVRNVKVKTDIIWGSDDTQTPLSHAHILEKSLKNCRSLTVIEGAKHAPYSTHPEQFVTSLLKVLEV